MVARETDTEKMKMPDMSKYIHPGCGPLPPGSYTLANPPTDCLVCGMPMPIEHARCGAMIPDLGDCVVCKRPLPCRVHKLHNYGRLYGSRVLLSEDVPRHCGLVVSPTFNAQAFIEAIEHAGATWGDSINKFVANLNLQKVKTRTETKEINMKRMNRKEAQELINEALSTVTPGTEITSIDVTPQGVYFEYQPRTMLGTASGPPQSRRLQRENAGNHVVACSFAGNSKRYNYVVKGGPEPSVGQYLRVWSPVSEREEVVQVKEVYPATGPQVNLKEAMRVGITLAPEYDRDGNVL